MGEPSKPPVARLAAGFAPALQSELPPDNRLGPGTPGPDLAHAGLGQERTDAVEDGRSGVSVVAQNAVAVAEGAVHARVVDLCRLPGRIVALGEGDKCIAFCVGEDVRELQREEAAVGGAERRVGEVYWGYCYRHPLCWLLAAGCCVQSSWAARRLIYRGYISVVIFHSIRCPESLLFLTLSSSSLPSHIEISSEDM